jgi:hypothetical protein
VQCGTVLLPCHHPGPNAKDHGRHNRSEVLGRDCRVNGWVVDQGSAFEHTQCAALHPVVC